MLSVYPTTWVARSYRDVSAPGSNDRGVVPGVDDAGFDDEE